MKWKIRTYAIYQMLSLWAIIFLAISIIVLLLQQENLNIVKSINFWKKSAKKIFTFNYSNALFVVTSFFLYLSIILILFSWFVGWVIFSCDGKNYYDALFLMFLVFPIISNIFALIGQMVLQSDFFLQSYLSKKDLNVAVDNLKERMNKIK